MWRIEANLNTKQGPDYDIEDAWRVMSAEAWDRSKLKTARLPDDTPCEDTLTFTIPPWHPGNRIQTALRFQLPTDTLQRSKGMPRLREVHVGNTPEKIVPPPLLSSGEKVVADLVVLPVTIKGNADAVGVFVLAGDIGSTEAPKALPALQYIGKPAVADDKNHEYLWTPTPKCPICKDRPYLDRIEPGGTLTACSHVAPKKSLTKAPCKRAAAYKCANDACETSLCEFHVIRGIDAKLYPMCTLSRVNAATPGNLMVETETGISNAMPVIKVKKAPGAPLGAGEQLTIEYGESYYDSGEVAFTTPPPRTPLLGGPTETVKDGVFRVSAVNSQGRFVAGGVFQFSS
jgi:hypothetical protein